MLLGSSAGIRLFSVVILTEKFTLFIIVVVIVGLKFVWQRKEMRGHFAVHTTAGLLSLMETLMAFPCLEAIAKKWTWEILL